MELKIEIEDRRYNDIIIWCKKNNLDSDKYILNAINERFMIDKYGDLNEKFSRTKNTNKETIVEEKIVEKVEKIDENVVSETKIEKIEPIIETKPIIEENKPIKKTRILKSK